MTDAELIAAGRKLVERRERTQWELGRLALAFAPILPIGGKAGVMDRIRAYAEEIGLTPVTLDQYRKTYAAWQDCDTRGVGYTVLHHCLGVVGKADFLDALAVTDPETKSGRWTATAALAFAHENGYLSHAGRADRDRVAGTLRGVERTRVSLAHIVDVDMTDRERGELADALRDLALEIATVRERLKAGAVGSRRDQRQRLRQVA